MTSDQEEDSAPAHLHAQYRAMLLDPEAAGDEVAPVHAPSDSSRRARAGPPQPSPNREQASQCQNGERSPPEKRALRSRHVPESTSDHAGNKQREPGDQIEHPKSRPSQF